VVLQVKVKHRILVSSEFLSRRVCKRRGSDRSHECKAGESGGEVKMHQGNAEWANSGLMGGCIFFIDPIIPHERRYRANRRPTVNKLRYLRLIPRDSTIFHSDHKASSAQRCIR
jgi:hypothetical protein